MLQTSYSVTIFLLNLLKNIRCKKSTREVFQNLFGWNIKVSLWEHVTKIIIGLAVYSFSNYL